MRHVKIERSTRNPSGVVKGTVESQSLKVKSKIKIRRYNSRTPTEREFKA